jgi:2-polyprenyl-6-methoxyphenol hydroxylase-like FAD-dependent oxidoreductase
LNEGTTFVKSTYDVAIVGARVAGAGIAVELARRGLDVVVFDRARLPSDTMSTHVIYPNTIARLDRLGVLDRVLAHRPPPLYTAWYHKNRMFVAPHTPEGGRDWGLCIRRSTLDRHLQDCAREAGVEIVDDAEVTDLLGAGSDPDPVRGLTARLRDRVVSIKSGAVIGADGVNSTVARLVGAKRERVMPTQTMLYYAYWTGVDTRNTQDFFFEPPWICAHFPADDGYHVVTMNGPIAMRESIEDLEAFYLERIRSIPQNCAAAWRRPGRYRKFGAHLGWKVFIAAGQGRVECCWATLPISSTRRQRKESAMRFTPRRCSRQWLSTAHINKTMRLGMTELRASFMLSANSLPMCRRMTA